MTGRTLRFAVLGLPAPQGSHRYVGNGVMVESSKKVKPWRADVRAAAVAHMLGQPWTGPLAVTVEFRLPRPRGDFGTGRNAGVLKPSAPIWHVKRPDADKLVRAVGDALTGLVWADDSQIVAWHTYKRYATAAEPVGATICVQELDLHPDDRLDAEIAAGAIGVARC